MQRNRGAESSVTLDPHSCSYAASPSKELDSDSATACRLIAAACITPVTRTGALGDGGVAVVLCLLACLLRCYRLRSLKISRPGVSIVPVCPSSRCVHQANHRRLEPAAHGGAGRLCGHC